MARVEIEVIAVQSGQTISPPGMAYGNVRSEVQLVRTLEPGEDADEAVRKLQKQARQMVAADLDEQIRQLEPQRRARDEIILGG